MTRSALPAAVPAVTLAGGLAWGPAPAVAQEAVHVEMDEYDDGIPLTPRFERCFVGRAGVLFDANDAAGATLTLDGECNLENGVTVTGYGPRAVDVRDSGTSCGSCNGGPPLSPLQCGHEGNGDALVVVRGMGDCRYRVGVYAAPRDSGAAGDPNTIRIAADAGDDASRVTLIDDPAGQASCAGPITGELPRAGEVVRLHLRDEEGPDQTWIFSGFFLEPIDADGDGHYDCRDNCPALANVDQDDCDGDGEGDACDTPCDCDGDGAPDRAPDLAERDNCVCLAPNAVCGDACWQAAANAGQQDCDGDGLGDVCDSDADQDGIEADTCPLHYDPGNRDSDGDGAGDLCDRDANGDCVCDSLALLPARPPDPRAPACAGAAWRDPDPDCDGHAAPADCDPCNPAVHPGAPEVCDGVDNDCDPDTLSDEDAGGGMRACYPDSPCACLGEPVCLDDGRVACACVEQRRRVGECAEACDNGVDDDCDGTIDEERCVASDDECPAPAPPCLGDACGCPDGGCEPGQPPGCCRVQDVARGGTWPAAWPAVLAFAAVVWRRRPRRMR